MQFSRIHESQQGFTLIEIMISVALLSISILGASYAFIGQKKATQGLVLQSQGQQIVRQIISRIEGAPGLFPYLLASTGNPITYVACFSSSGEPLPNTVLDAITGKNKIGYYGVDLGQIYAASDPNNAASKFNSPVTGAAAGSGAAFFCPQNKGAGVGMIAGYLAAGIEVHVSRLLVAVGSSGTASYGSMRIHTIILNDGSVNTNNRQYSASNTQFDDSIDVSVSMSSAAPAVPAISTQPIN